MQTSSRTPNSRTEPQRHPVHAGIRSTLVGVAVNGMLALFKGVVGYLGNSYALIADAIESLADVFSSLIVASGLKIAARPPDGNHPYGHGKAEPIAAILVACALFLAAVSIAIQSVREILTPHHAPAAFTLLALLVVVCTKEILFRYVFQVGESVSSTAVKTDAWHHRSDALTSLAAFLGISIALIGGKGYESADDWAALAASAVIAFNAYRLLHPALGELMDAAPSGDIEAQVRRIADATEGVLCAEKCLVRKMGLDYHVDLHLVVSGDISVREGHAIAHQVKEAIRAENPRIMDILIHVEPCDVLTVRPALSADAPE